MSRLLKRALQQQQRQAPGDASGESSEEDAPRGQRNNGGFIFLPASESSEVSESSEEEEELQREEQKEEAAAQAAAQPDTVLEDPLPAVEEPRRPPAAAAPATEPSGLPDIPTLWLLEPRHLDSANELGARFGKNTMRLLAAAERGGKPKRGGGGGRGGRYTRAALLASGKGHWPPLGGGVDMEVDTDEPTQGRGPSASVGADPPMSFVFVHSRSYRELQVEVEMATATGDPAALQRVLAACPYNTDGLVRLADYCSHTGQHELAGECVDKALHACEAAFHPQMRSRCTQGTARLRWRNAANRPFLRALFRQMKRASREGCHRTALELGKLLFCLDPEGDPMHLLLRLPGLALAAGEHRWLLALPSALPAHGLPLYPQYALSLALAERLSASPDGGGGGWGDLGEGRAFDEAPRAEGAVGAGEAQLRRALLLFPPLLPLLVRKVSPEAARGVATALAWEEALGGGRRAGEEKSQTVPHPLVEEEACGATLGLLLRLYASQHTSFWKERPHLWAWLLASADSLLRRLEARDEDVVALAADCAVARQAEYFCGAHEHTEFAEADPSDFGLELPAQLPAELLAAALADPDRPPPPPAEPRLPGRLVVPRRERLRLRAQTHPVVQFFLSLLPWAMAPHRD